MKKTTRNIIIIVAAVVAAIGIVLAIVLPITLRKHDEVFTVTFDSNGGSAVESITDVPYGSTITEPAAPTKDGYEFGGWFTGTNFSKQWVFDTDKVTSNITLYAKWNYNETSGLQMAFNSETNSYTVMGIGNATDVEDLAIPETHKGLPVTTIATEAFQGNKTVKTVFIPASVTTVFASAFNGCENLTSVTFGGELTTLNEQVFYECVNLVDVKLPSGLTTIEKEAFSGCAKLASIELSAPLTTLGEKAFGRCASLKEIVIPASLRKLGENVFAGCSGLEKLSVQRDNNTPFYSRDNNVESNCIIEITSQNGKTVNVLRVGCKNSQIPSGTSSPIGEIGAGAFCGSAIESIVIPQSVTSIGEQAFRSCQQLQRITIPSSVTYIGNMAFSFCYSLSEVKFAKLDESNPADRENYGIKIIGIKAFQDCYYLNGIYLPDSLTSIGAGAFYGVLEITISSGHTANNLQYIIGEADENGDTYTKQIYVACFDGDYRITGLM